jgi:hypothetical protein
MEFKDHKIIAKEVAEILAHNSELMRCLDDAKKILNDY